VEQEGQSSARHHFPPVREGYDRAAVDAYLYDLAAEVEALTRTSRELHERVRALGGELRALTASLQAGAEGPPPTPAPASRTDEPMAIAATEPQTTVLSFERSPTVPAAPTPREPPPTPAAVRGAEDLDGARLVALNMALEGQPRELTDAYLAKRFRLGNRAQLLDEVYAAIEG
jgi:DivIVA domain-containing protein